MGLGTEPESYDMDFATPETLAASGITQPTATTEKETWWGGDLDLGSVVSEVFDKLGIGDRAASEAEDQARMEVAVATAGAQPAEKGGALPVAAPTTLLQTPPSRMSVDEDSETPWYLQYIPHMAIGGLGLGAVIVLVLAMRKKKRIGKRSW